MGSITSKFQKKNKVHVNENFNSAILKMVEDLYTQLQDHKEDMRARCKRMAAHMKTHGNTISHNTEEIDEILKILQEYNTDRKKTNRKFDKLQEKVLDYNLICDNRIDTDEYKTLNTQDNNTI